MGILRQLEKEFDLDVIEDFLGQYSIMCDAMKSLIIKLTNQDEYANGINELFRIFHNIKLASSFLDLKPIFKLASVCEEIANEARRTSGPASEEYIDWLFIAHEQFLKYKNDVEHDENNFSPLAPKIIIIPIKLNS